MADDDYTSLKISLADIEDLLTSNDIGNDDIRSLSLSSGGQAYDQYRRPGSFLPSQVLKKYTNKVLDEAFRLMGQGGHENILQNFLSRLDRHGTVITPLNSLNYGYTFITRPRLNLSGGNLRQHPVMATLYSEEENSVPFMIRALLDTRLCNGQPLFRGANASYSGMNDETKDFMIRAARSGLVDAQNPFFVPLCNGLKGLSGFPDFNLETETTEGDFHSGDFTFVKGSDMNNRTQELSAEFRDVQGSVILSSIFYWCLVMALQAKGVMMAYPDDIYEQRLNYTVSIYRFVTDTTRKHILWWAKATGCFPKSAPIGALFNVVQGEVTISSAMNFSVPFVANDVKVNDPGILLDFNTLMKSYCPNIANPDIFPDINNDAQYNFIGLPYVESTKTGLQLKWKTSNYYSDSLGTTGQSWDEIQQETREAQQMEMEQMIPQGEDEGTYV